MSCDCIITLWSIDVTVTGEIAISTSSMMDFSLIAEQENGKRSFLLNFQGLKTNIFMHAFLQLLNMIRPAGNTVVSAGIHVTPLPYQIYSWSNARYGKLSV